MLLGQMKVKRLDHLVLTVQDIQRSVDFYTSHLGMKEITFGTGRKALGFGEQKINLHEAGKELEPKASHPLPGSADLCFIVEDPVPELAATLGRAGVEIIEGPVHRAGALGKMLSIYFRDPDGNLIEVSNYPETTAAEATG